MKSHLKTLALLTALAACADAPTAQAPHEVLHDEAEFYHWCTFTGAGTLATGDRFEGSMSGLEEQWGGVAVGTWTHITPDGDVIAFSNALHFCRINGSNVADAMASTATWNGLPGYEVLLHIQDRGHWAPERLAGEPEVRALSATRTYSPSLWEDGTLAFTAGALVEIPAALPVTVGNAGNQWARFTLELYGSDESVQCSYRGGASVPNPTDPTDVALGSSYEFVRCERYDAATGEWQHDPALAPGGVLDAAAVTLHLQGGSSRFPTADAARTTVVVDLRLTPFVERPAERDYYLIRVWDVASGELVHFADGDLTEGETTVCLDMSPAQCG